MDRFSGMIDCWERCSARLHSPIVLGFPWGIFELNPTPVNAWEWGMVKVDVIKLYSSNVPGCERRLPSFDKWINPNPISLNCMGVVVNPWKWQKIIIARFGMILIGDWGDRHPSSRSTSNRLTLTGEDIQSVIPPWVSSLLLFDYISCPISFFVKIKIHL